MVEHIKKYKFFYLFVYISIWTAMASTPMNEVFSFPKIAAQAFSLLLYVPFLVMVIWKFVSDLKCLKLHVTNIVYYLFAVYYVILSGYRLLTHGEVKEGIYYTIVLLGAFALFLQIRDEKTKISQDLFRKNVAMIAFYMIGLKLIISFLEGNVFSLSPINNLYSTSMLVMLLPFLFAGMRDNTGKKEFLYWLAFLLSIALILICSSRAITLLTFGILGVLFLFTLRSFHTAVKFVSAIACACLLVTIFATCNVGLVRRSLYRELSVMWPSSSGTTGVYRYDELTDEPIPDDVQMQNMVNSQVDRSDSMRSDLQAQGKAEFKKNPLFGTGDLYYTYDMGYKTMEQTAHNFILECLVCYGIVGTAAIIVMLVSMLAQCGMLRKFTLQELSNRVFLLLVMLHYFALGMVQPSVFNTLLCPLFGLLLAYYGSLILPEPASACAKSISLLPVRKEKQIEE